MTLAKDFFIKALSELKSVPEWNHEINYIRDLLNRGTQDLTADKFFQQYTFVVLCSYWKEQYARKEWQKYFDTGDFEVISNRKKRAAIFNALPNASIWFDRLMKRPDDKHKLEYIRTLPWMGGEALGYHLARNIGIDCVKPDRHLKRLADQFGFNSPLELCQHVREEIGNGEKIGVIDLIFWRWCNIHGSAT